MALYPTAIPDDEDYPNRTDDVDWIYAARYNEIKEEMLAICAELGISPSGAYETVVARLNAAIADKIIEGDSSVEAIDTGSDGHIDIKTENVLCGKYNTDGIFDLPKQSGCGVYISENQTIPNDTYTKVLFATKDFDTQNEFDAVTNNRFTCTKAGKYIITARARFQASVVGGGQQVCIYKNNAIVHRTVTSRTDFSVVTTTQITSVLELAANDYIEIFVYHDVGENQIIYAEYSETSLHIAKVA